MSARGVRLAALLLIAVASSTVAIAQGAIWLPPSGPATAEITALESTRDGSLLAGTVRGLYRSSDRGTSWKPVGPGVASGAVVALLQTGVGTIIASGRTATLRSTDDGETWTLSPLPDSGLKVFSSLMLDSTGAVFGCAGPWLFRSTDDGMTWTRTVSMFGSFASAVVDLLTVDSATRMVTDGRFAYRSVDSGLSWSLITIDSIESSWDIARSSDGTVLLIGRSVGSWGTIAFRSDDGGATWSHAIDGLDTTRVWSLRTVADDVLGVSTAGALRWNQATSSWVSYAPFAAATLGAIYHVPSGDTLLYSAGYDGISRSFDRGRSWSALDGPPHALVYSLACDSSGAVYASAGYGIYRSTDLGASWSRTSYAGRDAILAISARGTLVAALHQMDFIGVSTDDGASWSYTTYPRGITVTSLVAAPDGTIFGAGYDEIIRSTDDGRTWESIAPDSSTFPHRTLTLAPDGELFIATSNGMIIRSIDNGATWSVHARTSLRYFESMVALGGGDLLIAAYQVPVQRYHHASATVESLGAFSPTDSTVAYGLEVGRTGFLFARTLRGRIYRTRLDDPGSWIDLSDGLVGSATSMMLHPQGYVFAGVGGAGVQRTADAIATAVPLPERRTTIALHTQPQPARQVVTLAFTLASGADASIVISDLSGRIVATLPTGHYARGEHRVVVPLGGLASGVYVAELRGDAAGRALMRVVR